MTLELGLLPWMRCTAEKLTEYELMNVRTLAANRPARRRRRSHAVPRREGDGVGPKDLKIVERRLEELKPYDRNARRHPERQIEHLMGSIQAFGMVVPVLVNAEGCIIAGHARIEAARRLGLETVPTIPIGHLTRDQERALRLADNRLAELAEWDAEVLAIELQHLLDVELDFEIETIGFEMAEIDLIVEGSPDTASPDPDDDLPEMEEDREAVASSGDLWSVGEHRLLVADARESASFRTLLEDRRARLVFTDPPYNVPIAGNVSGLGRRRHGDFAMASGEMTGPAFERFLETTLDHAAEFVIDGGLIYVCIDWRGLHALQNACRRLGLTLLNLCVWNKTNAGMGSFYRSKHELVLVYKRGRGRHLNNIALGQYGRYRTNIWDYAGANTFRRGRETDLEDHPTVKPTAMVADAIRDCTRRGDLILDPFVGSGTTLVAAHRTGRIGFGIEIDPGYADVALDRLGRKAGLSPVLLETGETFAEVAARRAQEENR